MSTNRSNDNLSQRIEQLKNLRDSNDNERIELNEKRLAILSDIRKTEYNIQELEDSKIYIKTTRKKEIDNAIFFTIVVSALAFSINIIISAPLLFSLAILSNISISKLFVPFLLTILTPATMATLKFFYTDKIVMRKYKNRVKYLETLNLEKNLEDLNDDLKNLLNLININLDKRKELENQFCDLNKELYYAIARELSLSNEENENSKVKTLRKNPIILK